MARIAPHVGRATTVQNRKNTKDKDYLSFVHELPCVVTGRSGVVAAHLSASSPKHGHWGRAKMKKASDRFVLPLTNDQHLRSHNYPGGEMQFWIDNGISDPHGLCLALSGLFYEIGNDAVDECVAIIRSKQW